MFCSTMQKAINCLRGLKLSVDPRNFERPAGGQLDLCKSTVKLTHTVNQLNLTALKFSVLRKWTCLAQENLAFF